MILPAISRYKTRLRIYINGAAATVAILFTILQFSTGDHLQGSLSLATSLYFIVIVYVLITRGTYLWSGRGVLFIIPPTLLNTMHMNPDFGVFWAYAGVVSMFLVLKFKDAVPSAIVFTLLSFYFVSPHHDREVLYRIYASVIMVGCFSFAFSLLIERLLDRLDILATRDPLTKARNRHTFHTSINEALNENRRYGTVTVLMLFDLDHFKRINDTYGHITGDTILMDIAALVQNRLRDADLFFRYGGEEFAILLPQTSLQNAVFLAEDLRKKIGDHSFEKDLKVTISMGLTEVQQGDDVSKWIERTDIALYEAKASGRDCVKTGVPDSSELVTNGQPA